MQGVLVGSLAGELKSHILHRWQKMLFLIKIKKRQLVGVVLQREWQVNLQIINF